MILLWVTLLLLHQGYTLVPVTTVQLGEPVTLTCVLPVEQQSSSELHWYKQTARDSLKLIVKLLKHAEPEYEPGFSASRLKGNYEENFCSLTISETVQGDEGMYHCSITDWNKNDWHGTYLLIKGNSEKASNFTVIQQKVSDLNRPGGPETLQCSVLYGSDSKTCSGDLSVFWLRSRSDTSYPDIIYTEGNRRDECEKKSDSQDRCVFSMNVSSSESGTFYCAVATCGQIKFGNGTKLDLQESQDVRTIILLCVTLAISLIVIAILVCSINTNLRVTCKAVQLQKHSCDQESQKRDGWIYSAAVFTAMRADNGATQKGTARKRIDAVKALGLN